MRVLVAIPNYNNSKFLIETIDSVLNQRLTNDLLLDIVVFDNCSTDDSVKKIKENYKSDVLVIVNDKNIGAVGNHNKCIEYAIKNKYDFLKMLSSDDVLIDGILDKQIHLLINNPEVPFVTCDMLISDADLNVISKHSFYKELSGCLIDGNTVIKKCSNNGVNYFGGPSNFSIRVESIGNIRLDSSYRWVSDLKFACDLVRNKKYLNCGVEGFFYRRHSDADSSNILKIPFKKEHDMMRFCIEYGGGIKSIAINSTRYLASFIRGKK